MSHFGVFSIFPPLIAIFLAMRTRQVYVALICGVWAGYLILNHWHPVHATQATINGFVDVFRDPDNTKTIMFISLMGGLMLFIKQSGGVRGFIYWVERFLKRLEQAGKSSRKVIELMAFFTGFAIFIESTVNNLTIGTVFRPVFDKLKIPREKLAYIAHSCSTPVCMLIPLNAWGAYVVGLLIAQDIHKAPQVFLHSWVYDFYPVAALAILLLVIVLGKDFGPMKQAEHRAKTTGKLLRDGAVPFGRSQSEPAILKSYIVPNALNMLLPIIMLVFMMPVYLMLTGWSYVEAHHVTGMHRWLMALMNGSGATAVLYSVCTSLFISSIMYYSQGIFELNEIVDLVLKGVSDLISLALLMMLAFAIGKICRLLGTGYYVAQITEVWLNPALLPCIVFFVGCAMAFSMGTAWGTFAIMLPIAIPLAQSLGVHHPQLLYMCIAASLGGGVFGNHCSPIADTTLITALGSGNDPVDHIKTQLPYALLAALVTGIVYLVIGFLVCM